MKKIKNKEKLFKAWPVSINVGDVKMMPFMSYITNIMRTLGHIIFNRKLKINFMSVRTGNVEYIMTQKDNKCRYQKCDFPLSTPFRLQLPYP